MCPLQYKQGEQWVTFYEGKGIGHHFKAEFENVTAQYVRILILKASAGPGSLSFRFSLTKRRERLDAFYLNPSGNSRNEIVGCSLAADRVANAYFYTRYKQEMMLNARIQPEACKRIF